MLRRRTLLVLAAAAATATGALAANATAAGGPSQTTFGAAPGGFAAYPGVRLASDPKVAPHNRAVPYTGKKLVLTQSYVGRKAAEPALGVGRTSATHHVASMYDALPEGSPKNEPR